MEYHRAFGTFKFKLLFQMLVYHGIIQKTPSYPTEGHTCLTEALLSSYFRQRKQKKNKIETYFSTVEFLPNMTTMLHIKAKKDQRERSQILKEFLFLLIYFEN